MDRRDLSTSRRVRVRLFFLFHFVLGLGAVAGFFSANSLLVSRFGTSHLFHSYLGQGILTVLLSLLFYFLADRLPKKIFRACWFYFLGVLVLVSWAMLQCASEWMGVFLAVRALFDAVAIAASLGYWLMVGDQFKLRGAKKNYSRLMAAYIVGDMAGGLLLERAAAIVPGSHFVLLWGLLLASSPILFRGIFHAIPPAERPMVPSPIAAKPPTVAAAAVLNPLAMVLFVFWMVYSFFSDATDYLFNAVASSHWLGEDALTAFFGKVAMLANAGILAYHVLLAKPLLRRFGVGFAAALIPGLIAASWALAYFHPSLATLTLAQGLVYFFVDYLAIVHLHIPLTVFSKGSRGRVKACTEGLGRAVGFILLVCVAGIFSFRPAFTELGSILFLASLGFLLFPFLFRSVYLRHLLQALRARDRGLVLNALFGLGEGSRASAVPMLVSLYRRSRRRWLKRAIVRCFGRMGSREGMQAVLSGYAACDRPLQATIRKVCRQWKGATAPAVPSAGAPLFSNTSLWFFEKPRCQKFRRAGVSRMAEGAT